VTCGWHKDRLKDTGEYSGGTGTHMRRVQYSTGTGKRGSRDTHGTRRSHAFTANVYNSHPKMLLLCRVALLWLAATVVPSSCRE